MRQFILQYTSRVWHNIIMHFPKNLKKFDEFVIKNLKKNLTSEKDLL